jgi:hypothetical protein
MEAELGAVRRAVESLADRAANCQDPLAELGPLTQPEEILGGGTGEGRG